MGDIDNDFLSFTKNAGSHESDDFERVEDPDDFLITSSNNQDFTHSSTDRPLLTFDESPAISAVPSAPPEPLDLVATSVPTSLPIVPESLKYEDEEDEDDDREYERRYSQPPQPKKEKKVEAEVDYDSFEKVKREAEVVKELVGDGEDVVEDEQEVLEVEDVDDKGIEMVSAVSCSCPLSAWFNPQKLDPRVVDLIYWRDPKKSGVVFVGILVILLSLSYFSLISVLAYLTLAVLACALSFRIYKDVLAAFAKSNEGHPFKKYLDKDLVISNDQIQEITQSVVVHTNAVAHEFRRLLLVEDMVDSIKFGVVLWCLTYVGAWFNGMTLLILAFIAIFTLPNIYETNKTQIDHYIKIARTQVDDIVQKIKSKVPIGKKAKEQ